MNVVRAAVIQNSPVVFNQKATLEKVHSLVNQAAREGAWGQGLGSGLTFDIGKSGGIHKKVGSIH